MRLSHPLQIKLMLPSDSLILHAELGNVVLVNGRLRIHMLTERSITSKFMLFLQLSFIMFIKFIKDGLTTCIKRLNPTSLMLIYHLWTIVALIEVHGWWRWREVIFEWAPSLQLIRHHWIILFDAYPASKHFSNLFRILQNFLNSYLVFTDVLSLHHAWQANLFQIHIFLVDSLDEIPEVWRYKSFKLVLFGHQIGCGLLVNLRLDDAFVAVGLVKDGCPISLAYFCLLDVVQRLLTLVRQ